MERFFAFYNRAVRLFALCSLAAALLYFLFWALWTLGPGGIFNGILLGSEQPPLGEWQILHLSKDAPPLPETEEEIPLVL